MTRDNELNGLEHYERFLDAQRFGLTEQEQDLFHKALRRSVRPVITSKEPPAPMTRDKTTNPGAPMSDERLAEIESWLLDDPDFYINCTERQATDAIRELLAAVRVKECDPDKKCLLGQQLSKHIDYWSGKTPKLEAEIDRLRSAAGEVERMREALGKALQLVDIATDWNLDEVEIDGVMVRTHSLGEEFRRALAGSET